MHLSGAGTVKLAEEYFLPGPEFETLIGNSNCQG